MRKLEMLMQCVLGIYYYELGESKNTSREMEIAPRIQECSQMAEKASDKANPRAQYYLGLCYIMGKGTNENEFKGQELIYKSAISGYSRAQAFMANNCYWGMPRIDVSEEMTNKTSNQIIRFIFKFNSQCCPKVATTMLTV